MESIHQRGIEPVLIVVDTLARTFGGGNENQQQDMNRFVNSLYRFYDRLPYAAVWVNHHFNRNDESRGSSVLLDAMDFAFEMTVEKGIVRFECTKNRYGTPFEPFYGKPRSIVLDETGDVIRLGDATIPVPNGENGSFVLEPCDAPERNTGQIIAGHKLLDSDRKLLVALRDDPTGRLAHGTWGRWRQCTSRP